MNEPSTDTPTVKPLRLAIVTIVWDQDTGRVAVGTSGQIDKEEVALLLDSTAREAMTAARADMEERRIVIPPAEDFLPRGT